MDFRGNTSLSTLDPQISESSLPVGIAEDDFLPSSVLEQDIDSLHPRYLPLGDVLEERASSNSTDPLLGSSSESPSSIGGSLNGYTFNSTDFLLDRTLVDFTTSSYSSSEQFLETGFNTPDPLPGSISARPQNAFSFIYQGIANVVYGVVDPLTNAVTNVVSKVVQASAQIREPVASAGIPENNPFNLTVTSVVQNQEGDFSFFSAIPFEGFLAQYWQFQYNGNTGEIAGQLINNNASTGLAINALTVNETLPGMPYMGFLSYAAMDVGSTISGFITDSQMQVQISGSAPGLVSSGYVFQITTDLQRVG